MATSFMALVVLSLGFVAGTSLYDAIRRRDRTLLWNAAAMTAWLAALRLFYAVS